MMEATRAESQRARDIHCQSVMSRMWEFQSQDQFCDIAIKVDEKVFHCHRAILSAGSEYFHAMFGRGFSESTAKEVTLHEVDVNTFESILLFIYTGDVDINTFNIFDLVYAVGFYGIPLLEEHLIQFVSKTSPAFFSSDNILKMFTSARTAGAKSLSRFLSKFIYGDFGFYSDGPEFINLTWDSLMELANVASKAGELSLTDTFVQGILKWIRGQVDASVAERGSYFDQFVKIIRQAKSFTDCIQHVLDQYANAEQAPEKNAVVVLDERPQKLLRAFVSRPRTRLDEPRISSMFTLHEMDTGFEWAYSGELKLKIVFMKNVAIDDSLYTLIPDGIDFAFIRHQQAFTGAPHISMYQRQSLKPPPHLACEFDVCGQNNNFFLYNKFVTFEDPFPSSRRRSDFTYEELRRGVMMYKRDVDKWFSIPPPRKYDYSCITCDDKLVYLIGGKNSLGDVQCYDLRTPAWMHLNFTTGIYANAACCTRDGKVWVAGGTIYPTNVEIFDPIAGTWERGKDLIRNRRGNSRLINWDSVHHGRTIVSCMHDCYTNRKILFSSDRSRSGWEKIPSLYPALKDSRLNLSDPDEVEDMVVF